MKTEEQHKCIFLKDGKCDSDYARGLKCDGFTPPDKCPYDKKLGDKLK